MTPLQSYFNAIFPTQSSSQLIPKSSDLPVDIETGSILKQTNQIDEFINLPFIIGGEKQGIVSKKKDDLGT